MEGMNKLTKPLALAEARSYARSGYGRDVRVKAGLSLADVAGAIGVSTATVYRWETGKYRPAGAAALAWGRLIDALAARQNGGDAA